MQDLFGKKSIDADMRRCGLLRLLRVYGQERRATTAGRNGADAGKPMLHPLSTLDKTARSIRLDTLVRLRWLAIAGQLAAVLVVNLGFGFPLPMAAVIAIITVAIAMNVVMSTAYPVTHRLSDRSAAAMLGFDVVQLGALLYLTGGLENPFAILFLAPVMISATTLPPRRTLALGGLALVTTTLLAMWHQPLPWSPEQPIRLPPLYVLGVWLAILLGLSFIGIYAWRVAEENRQLGNALAATELILAREQHISQLDGLAAAAAHELGTPLATIALVVKELEKAMAQDDPHREDVLLLKEQTARCRQILGKIATLGGEPSDPLSSVGLRQLIEEVSAPQRPFHVALKVEAAGEGPEPRTPRSPGLIYGLENIIDNAVDFAATSVTIEAAWTAGEVRLTISDDGPGFPTDVLRRLGEPYVTTRKLDERGDGGGLGLGLFIAKTLIERVGATFKAANSLKSGRGAEITLVWRRAAFEQPGANA
jgi:two-component system, sensor histidine kinase RegB